MKLSKLLLLPLLVLGVAACGPKKPAKMTDQEIVNAVANDPALMLTSDGGLFEAGTTKQLTSGDFLLATKNYTYISEELDPEGNPVTYTPTLEWSFSDKAHWTKSGYSDDPTRMKFIPEGAFATEDEYRSDITCKITLNEASKTLGWHTYMNKVDITGTLLTLREYREKIKNGTISNSDNVIFYAYITGVHAEEHEYSGVYVQDGDAGIMLYAGNLSKYWVSQGLAVGDLVKVQGYLSPYNGLNEVKPNVVLKVKDPSKMEYTVATPTVYEIPAGGFNSAALLGKDGALVKMKDLTFITIGKNSSVTPTNEYNGSSSTYDYMWFKDSGNNEVGLYLNYHLADRPAMASFFKTLTPGTSKLNFNGHLSWYNAPLLLPTFGVESFELAK